MSIYKDYKVYDITISRHIIIQSIKLNMKIINNVIKLI